MNSETNLGTFTVGYIEGLQNLKTMSGLRKWWNTFTKRDDLVDRYTNNLMKYVGGVSYMVGMIPPEIELYKQAITYRSVIYMFEGWVNHAHLENTNSRIYGREGLLDSTKNRFVVSGQSLSKLYKTSFNSEEWQKWLALVIDKGSVSGGRIGVCLDQLTPQNLRSLVQEDKTSLMPYRPKISEQELEMWNQWVSSKNTAA